MKSILAAAILFLSCMLSSTAFRPTEIHRTAPIRTHSSTQLVPVQVEDNINNSRRSFLITATATLGFTIAKPTITNAVYGADAKIELPDIVQDMADRNEKQCLVESLGNRACLVYLDPENQLYKGSDAKLLFERLGSSIAALNDMPQYIENKQWNKVQGVLTGPMGTLSATMCELVKIVDDGGVQNKCKGLSVDIRKDLYAIAAAADRKQVKEALISYEKAEEKLEKFATLVSNQG
mmetsp:Transcript_15271/g.27763  ORF Transcript_15271/g.27763 Transcript_15271/m.27763 type:complete len:236 (+) Transcript_15271:195-902(+)|eukprot:CAMPEP_0201872142 /NCGR_PEP_ID=MMETSP0902-20130614/4917_1 /ASSEMBLY_ACC=CAM_ASM_000551 /TAXON_ID=420261 /ORGANISM="Thalassiosira antarctica, Strain CCMP982" /LENGTH=235 /DNA_ID=CAMNT_0048398329 /DNA_START=159 /DNA_END=866 /DNA_ORIENTATION=+